MLGRSLLLSFVSAFVLHAAAQITARAGALPQLKLPYATYQAASYNETLDIYTFKNIRFAAPPTGALRWAKPAAPLKEEGVRDGSVGYQCNQAVPSMFAFGKDLINLLEPASEDCLFLDVFVPGTAIRGELKDLPVLVWIYGGGYTLGTKNFAAYDGTSIQLAAENKIIRVAGNYRLGAFGFLGGSKLQAEGGVANAAFWDQRAVFQWVQDYIGLLGGNKNEVTAFGESAGGGSIMHHLIGNGGKLDPLFQRALIQSPANNPHFGEAVEDEFSQFETAVGCTGQGLACLRGKTTAELQKANSDYVVNSLHGTFGFGPTVDGIFVEDLPGSEFAAGKYWKNISSMIVSHTAFEYAMFTDPNITTDATFDAALKANFPDMTAANKAALIQLYPAPGLFSVYASQYARMSAILGDLVMNCNTRFLAKAYLPTTKVYAMRFGIFPGLHGQDLLFTFQTGPPSQKNVGTALQSYYASLALTGNPNSHRQKDSTPPTIEWPALTTIGSTGLKALEIIDTFKIVDDANTQAAQCDFWQGAKWRT